MLVAVSAFEAVVRLAVVGKVANPVHGVLGQGSGGENHRVHCRVDKGNHFHCCDETGKFGVLPVALNLDPLEPEVADDRVDSLELDARAEEGVGGREVRGSFPAGGQVVGDVFEAPGDHVAGRWAGDAGVVDLVGEERGTGVGAVVGRAFAGNPFSGRGHVLLRGSKSSVRGREGEVHHSRRDPPGKNFPGSAPCARGCPIPLVYSAPSRTGLSRFGIDDPSASFSRPRQDGNSFREEILADRLGCQRARVLVAIRKESRRPARSTACG